MRCFNILLITLLCAGCAHYEYDITSPPELARHIGTDEAVANFGLLQYHFRTYENHLIVEVANPTNEPVELLGDKSSISDPAGQNHPLQSETIAPQAFIKLIFPPIQPPPPPNDSSIGVGFSGTSGGPNDQPGQLSPRALGQGAGSDVGRRDDTNELPGIYYWDWEGQTDIQVKFVFRQGDQTFNHTMVIHRSEM